MSSAVRALALAGLIAAAPVAQAKPDFSGEWVLNLQASTLPPSASNIESGAINIEHREPAFRFRRTNVIAGASRNAEFSLAIRTDGKAVTQRGPQGFQSTSTLRWDGAALVLAMKIAAAGFVTTNDVRYELLDEGRRLRGTDAGGAPQGKPDSVWIYDRR